MNRLTITDLKEIINGHRSYSYSEQDIAKILSGNVIRVWKQNEAFAAKTKAAKSSKE